MSQNPAEVDGVGRGKLKNNGGHHLSPLHVMHEDLPTFYCYSKISCAHTNIRSLLSNVAQMSALKRHQYGRMSGNKREIVECSMKSHSLLLPLW